MTTEIQTISELASAMGRSGGQSRSKAKLKAVRDNLAKARKVLKQQRNKNHEGHSNSDKPS